VGYRGELVVDYIGLGAFAPHAAQGVVYESQPIGP